MGRTLRADHNSWNRKRGTGAEQALEAFMFVQRKNQQSGRETDIEQWRTVEKCGEIGKEKSSSKFMGKKKQLAP